MSSGSLLILTDKVKRIEHCGMHVDLIATSRGTVRVGSMPDIAKFLSAHGFREEKVVIPNWSATMAGDNYTGEEFVLWNAQVRGGIQKLYIGLPDNIEELYRQLDDTFSFFFDSRRISIIKKRWLKNWFASKPVLPTYTDGSVEIGFDRGNIVVSDFGHVLYDRNGMSPRIDTEDEIETVLSKQARDKASRDCLEIIPVGTGNGFVGTVANVVVRFGRYAFWIDPCGYPAHTLASQGVHWDDISHIIITHNHEDHIQGFSACLKRAEYTGKPLKLMAAKGVYSLLEKHFTPLCPTFKDLVEVTLLVPGKPMNLGPVRVESRWNHHFLPYGTLGLKITAGGKTFGYSGDTKFDESINKILKRDELTPSWFAACDLLFHEIDYDNPNSVHSHWKQVEILQRAISGQVLGYHTPFLDNAPLPLVREGQRYYLD